MATRIKLPKRLAGVKISKGIRKGPVVRFLNTPAGQVVFAQAVLLIGGAFAAGKGRQNGDSGNPLDALTGAGEELRSRASVTAAKLTRAFAAAAHAFRDAMESTDDDEAEVSGPARDMEVAPQSARDDEAAETPQKKNRGRSASRVTPH